MSSVRRVLIGLLASVGLLLAGATAVPVAHAEERTLTTFVVHLSAENEVPGCPAGVESGASGVAVVQIDAVTGEIRYRVVATNLPDTIAGSPGAHIHFGTAEQKGLIVQEFELTGLNTGLVAAGTAPNPTLAAAILANPENYYVNVHTKACPPGTVRDNSGNRPSAEGRGRASGARPREVAGDLPLSAAHRRALGLPCVNRFVCELTMAQATRRSCCRSHTLNRVAHDQVLGLGAGRVTG